MISPLTISSINSCQLYDFNVLLAEWLVCWTSTYDPGSIPGLNT